MRLYWILILVIFMNSCVSTKEDPAVTGSTELNTDSTTKEMEQILSKDLLPAKISISQTKLTVSADITTDDLYSKARLQVAGELMMVLLKDYLDKYDFVTIRFIVPNTNLADSFSAPISAIKRNVAMVLSDKMFYDFEMYIVKNLGGKKLENFWTALDVIYLSKKDTSSVPDYVEVVMNYALECKRNLKGDKNGQLLNELDKLLAKKELWPDYNPKDIYYFIDYCKARKGP